jgi:sec-independent protein translocase protein TatC
VNHDSSQFFESPDTIDPGVSVGSAITAPASQDKTSLVDDPSLFEHLKELRYRVVFCVVVLTVTMGIGFWVSLPMIRIFQDMAPHAVTFVQRSPGEVLMSSLMVTIYAGFALALPVILYHVLRFVFPGLRPAEKMLALWAVCAGTCLFALGVLFSYWVIVPSALIFLVDYGQSVAAPQLSIREYIGFCASLLFTTGGLFELPMVLFLLSFTGIVTSKRLIQEWRWALTLIAITAAIVTPTQDPLSMGLVSLAMSLLYALSIIPIRLINR